MATKAKQLESLLGDAQEGRKQALQMLDGEKLARRRLESENEDLTFTIEKELKPRVEELELTTADQTAQIGLLTRQVEDYSREIQESLRRQKEFQDMYKEYRDKFEAQSSKVTEPTDKT